MALPSGVWSQLRQAGASQVDKPSARGVRPAKRPESSGSRLRGHALNGMAPALGFG